MLPTHAFNSYYIILNVKLIHCLHNVWFKNNQGQVNVGVCIFHSVNSNAHTTPVKFFCEPYAHKFSAVDILWNITRCQAIPSFAKIHHVFGRGLMIQRIILIFFKCLSANQIQLYYMKV